MVHDEHCAEEDQEDGPEFGQEGAPGEFGFGQAFGEGGAEADGGKTDVLMVDGFHGGHGIGAVHAAMVVEQEQDRADDADDGKDPGAPYGSEA